jgi:hypothetical protein
LDGRETPVGGSSGLQESTAVHETFSSRFARSSCATGIRSKSAKCPKAKTSTTATSGRVDRLLAASPSPQQVADCLAAIEQEEMGLRTGGGRSEQLLHVAAKLIAIDLRLEQP